MNYFEGCTTQEERKTRLRKLAKQHHPDVPGGSELVMKEINQQYAQPFQASHVNEGRGFSEDVSQGWRHARRSHPDSFAEELRRMNERIRREMNAQCAKDEAKWAAERDSLRKMQEYRKFRDRELRERGINPETYHEDFNFEPGAKACKKAPWEADD